MNVSDAELAVIHRKLARKEKICSSDLIEFLATTHTVTKKFICDFLVDRSHTDSTISLITANMLIRDCSDANPCIRSASILALSSLHDVEEAAINYIHKAMKDPSPHVRRATSLSCLELSHHSDCSIYETGLVDLLYEGIRDPDPIVVTNCLVVLEALLHDEGGISINKTIVRYLLSRLDNFSDSGVIQIFNVLTKYTPKDENETIFVLNHLDSFFKSDSLAVLLAAVQLFFHITTNHPHLLNDMVTAIRYSVVNILSKNEFEYCAILLDFLLNLKVPLSLFFASQYKCFMLKFSDSNLIKSKKLQVLSKIADDNSVLDIITDLKHYSKDVRNYRAVYQCLGVLGNVNKEARSRVMKVSISSLSHSNYNIAACSLECILKLCLLDDSQLPKELMKKISDTLLRQELLENHAELSLCILESSCTLIPDVQQIFELLLNIMDQFSSQVRCRLLNVATACFLKLPITIEPILVPMIAKCFNSQCFSEVSCAALNYALIEKETNI